MTIDHPIRGIQVGTLAIPLEQTISIAFPRIDGKPAGYHMVCHGCELQLSAPSIGQLVYKLDLHLVHAHGAI